MPCIGVVKGQGNMKPMSCVPATSELPLTFLREPRPALLAVQVVLRYDAGRGPLTALAVTPEDCFLAGTAEGSVVLFAPDPRRRITTRFNLADVRPAAAQLSTPPAAAVEHGPGQAVAGSD